MVVLAAVPAAATSRPGRAPASVRVVECSPAQHTAVFYARMKRVRGARLMSVRLSVLERTGVAGFVPVRVPGLAHWRTSKPGRRGFAVRQRVRNLTDGGAYKARVEFRWKDREGALLRSTRRTSRACKVTGSPLPNLRARTLWARPTSVKGVLRYAVQVANEGGAVAEEAPVRLSVDGSEVNTRTVARLEPGEAATVFFRGPACERAVEASADPAGLIPEESETDNALRTPCDRLRE